MKKLSADQSVNASTTLAKITNLDVAMGVGTWHFKYVIVYRSDTTTTGIKFSVNHNGTVTVFVVNARFQEATTNADTGAATQALTTFGLHSGGAARAKSTTVATVQTISVDAANADMLMVIEGVVVVTAAGNLELYAACEVAAGIITVKQDSMVLLFGPSA